MKNPCMECDWHLSGGDKNRNECTNCKPRMAYARGEPNVSGQSMDLTAADPIKKQKPRGRPPGSRNTPKLIQVEEIKKPMNTKVCRKCKQEKPLIDFRKSNTSKDGRIHTCSDCFIEKIENGTVIKLDFGNYPEILDALRAAAENEFRTVEQQAMAIIRSVLIK